MLRAGGRAIKSVYIRLFEPVSLTNYTDEVIIPDIALQLGFNLLSIPLPGAGDGAFVVLPSYPGNEVGGFQLAT